MTGYITDTAVPPTDASTTVPETRTARRTTTMESQSATRLTTATGRPNELNEATTGGSNITGMMGLGDINETTTGGSNITGIVVGIVVAVAVAVALLAVITYFIMHSKNCFCCVYIHCGL